LSLGLCNTDGRIELKFKHALFSSYDGDFSIGH